jgi:hypothetical protein
VGIRTILLRFLVSIFMGLEFVIRGDSCKFSHTRLTPQEIPKFIKENEIYLTAVQKIKGATNLGDFFTMYLKQKEFENKMADDQSKGVANKCSNNKIKSK